MAKITGVTCIRTRQNGTWTIVKVTTDQDGLYGLGSATDLYNPEAVVQIVEQLLEPLLIGRDPANIEDLWQLMHHSGYWRSGALLNTAIGGIDMALWDIKGKEAGLPVYQLLGGAARSAVACYGHAGGRDAAELKEDVARFIEEGYTVLRVQMGGYGGGGFIGADRANMPRGADTRGQVFDEHVYVNAIPAMFESLRVAFGDDVQFTHDVHEHLSPIHAVRLARRLEPYGLFFLEDVLPPDQIGWYRQLRQQCATPQAVGELFTNPQEWVPLISERLIDFIRVRVSKAGGDQRVPQDRGAGRSVRRADCLAGGRRERSRQPGGRRPSGYGDLELRHSGGQSLPAGGAGRISRTYRARGRIPVSVGQAGTRHRHRRGAGRRADRRGLVAPKLSFAVPAGPQSRRHDRSAMKERSE
ncbi:enolase C-terminal domain-like protein [Cohnella rhizosphaerae]